MYRRNAKGQEYYTVPGGGVEEGESLMDAVVREMFEECSISVEPVRQIFTVHRPGVDEHHHVLCRYISGVASVHESAPEFKDNLKGEELHIPTWIKATDLPNTTLYPEPAKAKLLKYLTNDSAGNP